MRTVSVDLITNWLPLWDAIRLARSTGYSHIVKCQTGQRERFAVVSIVDTIPEGCGPLVSDLGEVYAIQKRVKPGNVMCHFKTHLTYRWENE